MRRTGASAPRRRVWPWPAGAVGAAVVIGCIVSVASGTSHLSATTSLVPVSIAGAAQDLASNVTFPELHADPADLQCNDSLIVIQESSYAQLGLPEVVSTAPTNEEVLELVVALSKRDNVPVPMTVLPATSRIVPNTLQSMRVKDTMDIPAADMFVGRGADGKVSSIVSLGQVNGALVIEGYVACSSDQLQPHPDLPFTSVPVPSDLHG